MVVPSACVNVYQISVSLFLPLSEITSVTSQLAKLQNWVITGFTHFKTFLYSEAQQYSKMTNSDLKGFELELIQQTMEMDEW